MVRKPINIEEVKAFIDTQTPATKIYIGGDSERMMVNNVWYADYTNVVVVHMNGNRGCRVLRWSENAIMISVRTVHLCV